MLVIARAYGDRPLVREVTGASDGLIYLINPSAAETHGIAPFSGVGFPACAVYEHDQSIAESLASAWEAGDVERLTRLWETAPLKAHGAH